MRPSGDAAGGRADGGWPPMANGGVSLGRIRRRLRPSERRSGTLTQKLIINLAVLGVIWIFLAIFTPRFLTVTNLTQVIRQVSDIAIVASVVTLLMVSLNFDLSVGGVLAFSGCVTATLAIAGLPLPLAFVAGTLLGSLVGVVNGFLVLVVGINSVIATLGMMYATRGAALLTTNGVSISVLGPAYKYLGGGYVDAIPIPVIVMLVIVVVMQLVSRRTLIGKYARATGSNQRSAQLSGVPTRTVQFILFVLAGTAAGFAGVMESSRNGGGFPTIGVGFELEVIVAAVLGGTSLFGGEGTVIGTLIGAVIVGSVNNGLDLLQVPTFWQTVALGLVLLFALGLDTVLIGRSRHRRSQIRRDVPAYLAAAEEHIEVDDVARVQVGEVGISATPILSMTGVSKSFGGVHALTEAAFEVRPGEVHAILGENGAGKSTLVKIIAGALRPDDGVIRWQGEPIEIQSFQDADRLGIHVIYQQANVLDHLTVAENIALARERSTLAFVDVGEERRRAKAALATLGVELDVEASASTLRVAEKQIVEIARALWGEMRLLIMDEPTASLGDREVDRLFAIIHRLRERGVAIIFISHKLDEVFRIADRTTVLRNGETVGTVSVAETSQEDLILMMVGRRLGQILERREQHVLGGVVLKVESLSTDTGLSSISFDLREGEVLGVYGLLGSGRTELARALFGADPIRDGSIIVSDHVARLTSPADAKRLGFGLVPEERSQAGFQFLSIRENLSAASSDLIAPQGWLRPGRERKITRAIVDTLRVRTPTIEEPLARLSGGNQQKVIVGRWLLRDVPILIMDDPSSGIDVGAKADLYGLIREMTARRTAVIMTSSELPELVALSDRIMVLHRGRLAGVLEGEEITREKVVRMAIAATEIPQSIEPELGQQGVPGVPPH
jgi:ribose transport system ATP-binding protein